MYNRESKIMRKLLGKTAADSSGGDLPSMAHTPSPMPAAYRPSKSQNAVYPAGVPIACFDVAPDRRAAVLAGPHILKTVALDTPGSSSFSFSEGVDVRAAITTRQAANPRASVVADQLNIRDVKWHGNSTIFTACASGKIYAYDLTRLGAGSADPLEYIQMQEDSRQVNTLDVNPHLKSWVLSGSQDGTARVFDASTPVHNRAGVLTFRQRFATLRCIDSVRQVKWSPKVGHEMACCTEGGVVLKWDVRQPARPLLRINAHEKACAAIAWHPDGIHLMSAGWDTKLHTWDLGGTADKRQKPKWTISTPAPVSAIAWRPALWSATAQTRRVAQVAVTYDETSNRRYGTSAVHIWDLARPTMPYKEIERFESSPTALSWQDQDMLWTVGQDGMFNQCDVAFAPKVIDRQSSSAMAFSPRGDALVFLDERAQMPRRRPSVTHEPELIHRQSYSSSPNAPKLSISRSDSEEEVMGTFLGPRRRMGHRRRLSARSGMPLSTTPPSGPAFPDDPKQALSLEQSISVTGVFKTQQAMASGHIPAAKSVNVYQYLSSAYLETLEKELPYVEGGRPLGERVGDIMEQFAKTAENANLYRLAQTWRILAYAMALLLDRRAQYHLECRVGHFQKMSADDGKGSARLKLPDIYRNDPEGGEDTPRRPSTQRGSIDSRFLSRSLLAEEIESTSNVPTPIARPVDIEAENEDRSYQYGRRLTPIVEPESLNLGPAAHGSFRENFSPRQRHDSGPISVTSEGEQSQISCTEGYDFYGADMLAKAIDVPIRNDGKWGHKGQTYRGRTVRHDSDESLGQMFSVSNGTKLSTVRSSSSGDVFAKPTMVRQTSDMERSSVASSAEYGSRTRGDSLTESPTAARTYTASKNGAKDPTDSPEEVFMISQTTKSDESVPSQPSFSGSEGRKLDAKGRGPSGDAQPRSVPPTIETNRAASTSRPALSPRHDPRRHIIEYDYLPWDDDPPYPHPLSSDEAGARPAPSSPLDPTTLLARALAFEARTSALNASAMVLLLRPLVPAAVIDAYQAGAILRQQHARLMRMGLFVEAALLRNLCVRGWPAGLPDWGASHTAIFAPAQQGVKVGFFCRRCRKPREVDPSGGDAAIWTCERCRGVMGPCAVCGHRELERPAQMPAELADAGPAPGEAWLSEWWYCPGCAHGGHASCLAAWHAPTPAADASAKYSDGCCPSDGCGHACLPGKYRGETTTARADELARLAVDSAREHMLQQQQLQQQQQQQQPPQQQQQQQAQAQLHHQRRASGPRSRGLSPPPGVRSDANDVPQSRAVGMAREALNTGGGILSSSPGRASGERERRKSVKFARTDRG